MLNVKHRKVKREVEQMLIPALAGVLIGEGLSRVQQREICPKFVKERMDSLTSPLNETPLAKIILGVFLATVLSHLSLSIVSRGLKDRVNLISTPCQKVASLLGAYRTSIPMLLSLITYLGRRKALIGLLKYLENLYELVQKISNFFVSSASNPDELIEKARQELREGIQGICESARYMIFANEPAVIRTIDREIGDFEEHLRTLGEKMPRFERKLETAKELLSRTRQELTLQINAMEQQSEEVSQLFETLDREYSGYWEETWKELLGYQALADKQKEFQSQLETMRDLAKKVDLIMSGLRLINQTDGEEIKAIRRWNIYIGHTPLPVLEDAFLIACDMPNLGFKMFNEIVFNTRQRSDDLWSFRRRRIKLSEILSRGVSKFSQALILFKQARKSILDCLTDLKVTEPCVKENWTEERETLEQGRRHFNEADLMFCEKLFPSHQVGKIAGALCAQGKQIRALSKEIDSMKI